jgi:hypothetical protein
VMYLTALLILHILSPKLEPAKIGNVPHGKPDRVLGFAILLSAVSASILTWSVLFRLVSPLAVLTGPAPADLVAGWAAFLSMAGFIAGLTLAIKRGRSLEN